MGSMLARSEMEKKRIDDWMATGLYPRRALSILTSVSSAIAYRVRVSNEEKKKRLAR